MPTCNWKECPLNGQMDRVDKNVSEIHKLLVGNGKPGLFGRIDRIEQRWTLVKWIGGGLGTLALAATTWACSHLVWKW